MKFWSGVANVFKAIGRFFVDFTVELPKIVHAGDVALANVPSIVTDLGNLLNAVAKLAAVSVADAKPIITALVTLGTSIFAALSQGLENVGADIGVVNASKNLIGTIQADYSSFANFSSALNAVVQTYDNTAAAIEKALKAVEQAVK